MTRDDLHNKVGHQSSSEDFYKRLQELDFQWPLKPYGVDKSLEKTAVMNKGAETRIYMKELEARGLYDPHNPTGPLPSSLRPRLNQMLQVEGISRDAADQVYKVLLPLEQQVETKQAVDYYDFLDLFEKDSVVTWE
jgi:hypothetical protein